LNNCSKQLFAISQADTIKLVCTYFNSKPLMLIYERIYVLQATG